MQRTKVRQIDVQCHRLFLFSFFHHKPTCKLIIISHTNEIYYWICSYYFAVILLLVSFVSFCHLSLSLSIYLSISFSLFFSLSYAINAPLYSTLLASSLPANVVYQFETRLCLIYRISRYTKCHKIAFHLLLLV